MKLHTHPEEFRELITVVANEKHISESAVERDYYIVMMLKSLADSPYADQCVFKGGTSLSKCYPGSIDRFSEDIDLTGLHALRRERLSPRTEKAPQRGSPGRCLLRKYRGCGDTPSPLFSNGAGGFHQ